MKPLETALSKAGYVRSPNKIQSDIQWTPAGYSPIWYAGSMNIPEPKYGHEVEVLENTIRVFKTNLDLTSTTIAQFDTVECFWEWCKINGQLSEPGLPPYYNSWD